jgi:hypothetical protein
MTEGTRQLGPKPLFSNDFYLTAGLEPVARVKPVQGAETLNRVIGNRHFAGELLHRIAWRHGDDLQAKRLCVLDFGEAHTAERADRFSKSAVGL